MCLSDYLLKYKFYEYSNGNFVTKSVTGVIETNNHTINKFHKFHGQAGQDQVVVGLLDSKTNGYFVDLAANHYMVYSNTFTIEQKFNWSGICIEPNPQYLLDLVRYRLCKVLVNPVSNKNDDSVSFKIRTVFSGIIGKDMDNKEDANNSEDIITLTTVTLSTLLTYFRAPTVIDYLSLDVEGAESLVLQGFDFKQYTFLIITIERPTISIHSTLTSHQYWFYSVLSNWGDVVYVHRSIPNFHVIMDKMVIQKSRNTNWHRASHHYLLEPIWKHDIHQE